MREGGTSSLIAKTVVENPWEANEIISSSSYTSLSLASSGSKICVSIRVGDAPGYMLCTDDHR